jgi:hypothetical protein
MWSLYAYIDLVSTGRRRKLGGNGAARVTHSP